MRREGLTLRFGPEGGETICEIVDDGRVEARGAVRDGRMVGAWSTFASDGTVRTCVDVTAEGAEVTERLPLATRNALAAALARVWAAENGEPPWLRESGARDLAWDELEDGSRVQSVAAMPLWLRGVFHPDPLVHDTCLMQVHLGIVDESSIGEATAPTVRALAAMVDRPDAPVAGIVAILDDVRSTIGDLVGDLEIDLEEDDEDDVHFRPTVAALKGALPALARAAEARSESREAIDALVGAIEEGF